MDTSHFCIAPVISRLAHGNDAASERRRADSGRSDVTTPSTTVRPSPAALPVLTGLLRDAVLLVQRGTATREDVDTAMRLGAGHPTGPLDLLELLGREERGTHGLPAAPPRSPAAAPDGQAPPERWTGPVGVLGTGHMAAGIVEAVARTGRPVHVLTRSARSADGLRTRIAASLQRAVTRGRLDAGEAAAVLGRLSMTEDPAALAGVDVVVEAVAEDLQIKSAVLASVDAVLPAAVPLATNTSSYRVADLRPAVGAGRALLALHFFNPAPVMELVEVVVPDDVPDAPALRSVATRWAQELGKSPVTSADSRGFVVNRLLIPFLNDAVRLHEQGRPVAEVDELLRAGAGHPMGPLALVDLIGVDVTIAALESMAAVEDDPRITPSRTLYELAAGGRLGRKTGAGFHAYERTT